MQVPSHCKSHHPTHCVIQYCVMVMTRPVRYYDNIVYRDNFSNIAIQYFLLAIAIAAIEI